MLRGGSWNNNPENCRAANRNNNVGFRVCRSSHIVSAPVAPAFRGATGNAGRLRFAGRDHADLTGHLSFAEFDASVRGSIAHADSWGLRRHLLDAFRLKPGDVPGRGGR